MFEILTAILNNWLQFSMICFQILLTIYREKEKVDNNKDDKINHVAIQFNFDTNLIVSFSKMNRKLNVCYNEKTKTKRKSNPFEIILPVNGNNRNHKLQTNHLFFLMAVANLVGRFIRTRQKKEKISKEKSLNISIDFFSSTKCIGYGQFDFYKFLFFHSNNQSTNSKLGCIRWKIKFLLL